MGTTPLSIRLNHRSLTLGAALIFMLNALLRSPSSYRQWTTLADAVTMRIAKGAILSREEQFHSIEGLDADPIRHRQGLFFLCDIVHDDSGGWWWIPESTHLGQSHVPDVEVLTALYEVNDPTQLQAFMSPAASKGTKALASTSTKHLPRDQTIDAECIHLDNVADLGLELDASGVRVMQMMGPNESPSANETPARSMDEIVNRIIKQFAVDVIGSVPNPRAGGSYLSLSPSECSEVTVDIFKQKAPFKSAWVKVARSLKDFLDAAHLDRLFPEKNSASPVIPALQNCAYFRSWKRLMEHAVEKDAKKIRTAILEKVLKNLYWVPLTKTDKLWDTTRISKTRDGLYMMGEGTEGSAPHIVVNPAHVEAFKKSTRDQHVAPDSDVHENEDTTSEAEGGEVLQRILPQIQTPRLHPEVPSEVPPAVHGTASGCGAVLQRDREDEGERRELPGDEDRQGDFRESCTGSDDERFTREMSQSRRTQCLIGERHRKFLGPVTDHKHDTRFGLPGVGRGNEDHESRMASGSASAHGHHHRNKHSRSPSKTGDLTHLEADAAKRPRFLSNIPLYSSTLAKSGDVGHSSASTSRKITPSHNGLSSNPWSQERDEDSVQMSHSTIQSTTLVISPIHESELAGSARQEACKLVGRQRSQVACGVTSSSADYRRQLRQEEEESSDGEVLD